MKIRLNHILLSLIIISISSCSKDNNETSTENYIPKTKTLSESNVTGFYSGQGLYNMATATVNLYYGGSFVMEDPYLPDGGTAYGDWVLNGSSIDFYMEGQKIFSARISRSGDEVKGIILKGSLWKKLR